MKNLVFFNNKGGVGKTTLTCNVVSFMNMHKGKRVLLIDADPQCNATQAILEDDVLEDIYFTGKSSVKTLYHYLRPLEQGDATIDVVLEPVLAADNSFGCDLIPSHPNLSLIEDRLSQAWTDLTGRDSIRGFRISNWMSQLLSETANNYDLVVFDVGPSLGALNRTILLAADYFVTPFGSDIFSLLGIRNISSWLRQWSKEYDRALSLMLEDDPNAFADYPGIRDTRKQFRLAGYSVQQYVTRTFKTGRRPVRAYDDIMTMIPTTVEQSLGEYFAPELKVEDLELGHVPFLYSLVPLAQASKVPIHELANNRKVAGAQVKQVDEYNRLLTQLREKLLVNIGA